MKKETENKSQLDLISIKELAQLLDLDNWQAAYNNLRQKVVRGKFKTYQLIDGKGFVSLNDAAIPAYVKSQPDQSLVKKTDSPNELSAENQSFALAAAELVEKFIAHKNQPKFKGKKAEAEKIFVDAYNNEALNPFPVIYKIVGGRSFKTLRNWETKYLASGKDFRVLAPQYKQEKPISVTPEESEILVRLLLSPGKPLATEVVRQSINYFEMKRFPHIKSHKTYQRFIERWIKENYAKYIFCTEGEKGLDDKVLPYIERDWTMVEVGDILIMDGHVNNYEIINPFTGRAKRMVTMGAIDGRSQYLCGYEIAITENIICIASALRRAILQLGKIPKVVYIDNGKAFGAKYFHGDDFEKLSPLFARLGIKTIFAKKYHAQSKPIEPFWDWMAELERLIPTYVGTSIEMQPPRLNRGEFIHRKLYDKAMQNITVDIFAAHRALAWWLDNCYHNRPKQSGHLKDLTPEQVFNEGKNSNGILRTDRKTFIDKKELNYLMMEMHITTLYRKGVRFFGNWYWSDSLFGQKLDTGDEIVIKYDLFDRDSILVYDNKGNFVCEATEVSKIHPAADLLGLPEHQEEFKKQIAQKEKLKTSVVGAARKTYEEEIFPFVKNQLKDTKVLQLPESIADDAAETKPSKSKKKNISDRWNLIDAKIKKAN
jgi:putative transposase